ncbi:hypothetical protein ACB092_05G083400 [Castanea dentata]
MSDRGCVRWDEANLVENEDNRPVRKNIFEPKTPFHQMIEKDDTSFAIPDFVDVLVMLHMLEL